MAVTANNLSGREVFIKGLYLTGILVWLYIALINPIMRLASKDKNANKGGAVMQMVALFVIPLGGYGIFYYSARNSSTY
jgi:hypothetical protein